MSLDLKWPVVRARLETFGPALLAIASLAADGIASRRGDDYAVGTWLVMAAAATGVLSGAHGALLGWRRTPTRAARRFAGFRLLGVAASVFCFALESAMRLERPDMLPTDAIELGLLGIAWALLTAWVWGERSWNRLVSSPMG